MFKTKNIAMITPLHSRIKNLFYILLIPLAFSSCHSTRHAACPEINTDQHRAHKFRRHISLAWNQTRKVSKKRVLIKPVTEVTTAREYENDMTLLENRSADFITTEQQVMDNIEYASPDNRNTLIASTDDAISIKQKFVVFDGTGMVDKQFDQPSNKEVRKIKREIRKEMRNTMKSSGSGRLNADDPIMLFAVTSFVLGILGIFTMPLLLGLLATIFGAVALSMIRREGVHYGRGLALAGLIIGIVLILVGIILLPFAILGLFI